jgi:hypothetical protein
LDASESSSSSALFLLRLSGEVTVGMEFVLEDSEACADFEIYQMNLHSFQILQVHYRELKPLASHQ